MEKTKGGRDVANPAAHSRPLRELIIDTTGTRIGQDDTTASFLLDERQPVG